MGAGVQARTQLWGMASGANLERALIFSLDPPEAQRAFADDAAETLGIPVEVAGSGRELVEGVDILSLATTATTPIIDGDWVKPGLHINGIGSHAVGVRELDTKTVVKSKLVCDQVDACLVEAGDVMLPIEEGALDPADIYGEIGELITGAEGGTGERRRGDAVQERWAFDTGHIGGALCLSARARGGRWNGVRVFVEESGDKGDSQWVRNWLDAGFSPPSPAFAGAGSNLPPSRGKGLNRKVIRDTYHC